MSRKSKIIALTAMGLALGMGSFGGHSRMSYDEQRETEQERKERLAKAEVERNIRNGLRPFQYGEVTVWALNKKNADRKFNNLNK